MELSLATPKKKSLLVILCIEVGPPRNCDQSKVHKYLQLPGSEWVMGLAYCHAGSAR